MATGMEHYVEPPKPQARPWGLLLQAAIDLGLDNAVEDAPSGADIAGVNDDAGQGPAGDTSIGRWRAGLVTQTYGCGGLEKSAIDDCLDTENLDSNAQTGAEVVFPAFSLIASERCSALGRADMLDWLNGRLNDRYMAMASEQVAEELMIGGASGGTHNFVADATVLTTGAIPINVVLATLEQHLANVLHDAVGMIHLTPAAFASLLSSGFVERIDDDYRTKSGHYIVNDAGYTGPPPTGEGAVVPGLEWAYASGMVAVQVGPPINRSLNTDQAILLNRNRLTGRAIGEAVLLYDPCTVGAAQFAFPIELE